MGQIEVVVITGIGEELDFVQTRAAKERWKCELMSGWEAEVAIEDNRLDPDVALIHLSTDLESRVGPRAWNRAVLDLLPGTTRRVLVAGGSNTLENSQGDAIRLGADAVVALGDLLNLTGMTQYLLEEIVKSGRAAPWEINERGKTVLIRGERRGLDAHRERDDDKRKWNYKDNYYKK